MRVSLFIEYKSTYVHRIHINLFLSGPKTLPLMAKTSFTFVQTLVDFAVSYQSGLVIVVIETRPVTQT